MSASPTERHPLSTPAIYERLLAGAEADSVALLVEAASVNYEWLSAEAMQTFVAMRICLSHAEGMLGTFYDELDTQPDDLPYEQIRELDLIRATIERSIESAKALLLHMTRRSVPPGFYHDDPRNEG